MRKKIKFLYVCFITFLMAGILSLPTNALPVLTRDYYAERVYFPEILDYIELGILAGHDTGAPDDIGTERVMINYELHQGNTKERYPLINGNWNSFTARMFFPETGYLLSEDTHYSKEPGMLLDTAYRRIKMTQIGVTVIYETTLNEVFTVKRYLYYGNGVLTEEASLRETTFEFG